MTNASFWRQEQAKKKKKEVECSIWFTSASFKITFASTGSSDSLHTWLLHFLPPPSADFFNANSYRTRRSTGNLLLCKKDLCSLRTKCADPLLKNRYLKPKPPQSVHMSVCIYMCRETENALSWFGLTQWDLQPILLLRVLLRQRC